MGGAYCSSARDCHMASAQRDGKPCRVCGDFKTWQQQQKSKKIDDAKVCFENAKILRIRMITGLSGRQGAIGARDMDVSPYNGSILSRTAQRSRAGCHEKLYEKLLKVLSLPRLCRTLEGKVGKLIMT